MSVHVSPAFRRLSSRLRPSNPGQAIPSQANAACTEPTTAPALRTLIVAGPESRCGLGQLLRDCHEGPVAIRTLSSSGDALAELQRVRVDLLLIVHPLPEADALELVSRAADLTDDTAIILISGQGDERLAADAIKQGAEDYLPLRELNARTLGDAMTAAVRTARLDWKASQGPRVAEETLVGEKLDETTSADETRLPWRGLGESAVANQRRLSDSARALRPPSPARGVALGEVLGETLREHQALLLTHGIQVRLAAGLPHVACGEIRLKRAFAALLRSVVRSGRPVENRRISVQRVEAPAGRSSSDHVWIRFHDTSSATRPQTPHIAIVAGQRTPYPETLRWGIELAILRRTIDHYGGAFLEDETSGDGTAFLFSLPRAL